MIETILLIVVATAAICIIILFGATARVALNRVLYEDKKRIAALADEARLTSDPRVLSLKLQEISAIAKGDKFDPEVPAIPPMRLDANWTPPAGKQKKQ